MTEKLVKLPETWEANLAEENRMLKEFIGNTTADRIRQLEQAEQELSVVKAQNEMLKQAYNDLNSQVEARIKQAVNYTEYMADIEKREAVKKKENNIQYNKLRPLEKERDQYKEMLEKLQESLNEALSKIGLLLDGQAEIKRLIQSDRPKEEVIQQIDKIIAVGERKSKEENIAEIHKIYELTQQGLTNKEIADRLGWKSARGTVKVSEKRKTQAYMELENKG